MGDETTFEERKRRYIESAEAENIPPEKSYWQYPAPTYHHTSGYAAKFPQAVNTDEPMIFKNSKRQWLVAVIMLIVAGILVYIIGEKSFGFAQLLFLALLLLVVLPSLLDNKPKIMISHQSIWLSKEDKNIEWKNVLLTYIKEVHQEHPGYFFVVHYYDEGLDQFMKIEMDLDGLVSPGDLAATAEAFKRRSVNSQ